MIFEDKIFINITYLINSIIFSITVKNDHIKYILTFHLFKNKYFKITKINLPYPLKS